MSAPVATRRTALGGATVPPRPRAAGDPARRLLLLIVAVFAVAFAARMATMLGGGGLDGLGAYDDGVYYAAADALVHGRLPYRDFLLIHPPLIALVTAPFAALGSVTTDMTGFVTARIAFMAFGGLNAVLCSLILRRFGLAAAVLGGIGYALFQPAVHAERSVLLEPLGTFCVLAAVLLLLRARSDARWAPLAGVLAGAAACVKIWYVVPAALLVLMAGSRRLRSLAGVVAGGALVCLPFFVAAPSRMLQQVVLDQLGRDDATSATDWGVRITTILGAQPVLGLPVAVTAIVIGASSVVAVVVGMCTAGARTFGVLAVATVVVLLVAPSWYEHYSGYTAPWLVLCVAVAGGRAIARLRTRALAVAVAVPTLLVVGVLVVSDGDDSVPNDIAVPSGLAQAAAQVRGCVTADDPGALIAMDLLTRDLTDASCDVRPDVTGWAYQPGEVDRAADGETLPLTASPRWQAAVLAYLESGAATIRIRPATGLDAASRAVIDGGRVLVARGGFVVHATR